MDMQEERYKNRAALYPAAEQEAVLLQYCKIAAQVYENYRSLRKEHHGRFGDMEYALRATSRSGKFSGVPVWLVLRMVFAASMDIMDGVSREDVGSFFGLGSDALYLPNAGLVFEGLPGYLEVQKVCLPAALPDLEVHQYPDGWYMIWR